VLVALCTFTLAAVLIVLLPGPDSLVVVRNIIRGGRALGIRTAAGNLCGLVVWVAFAALGLTALLRASEIGFEVLRIVGALYLCWLGVQAWRSRGPDPTEDSSRTSRTSRSGLLGSGYVAGLLTNLLNPKVGVFFVAFLPAFIPRGYPVGSTTLLFGAIFVLLTALYWLVLLSLAAKVTDWLSAPKVRRWLDRVTGTILIAFGLRLATES
jgi:RhtB (resistance to homoserine/threonine) family protein